MGHNRTVAETTRAEIKRLESQAEILRTGPEGAHVIWRKWGRGPNLILLHGGSGTWLHWIRNIEALAQHYTLYVPDLPGHGESGFLEGPDADLLPHEINDIAEPGGKRQATALFTRPVAEGIEALIPEGPLLIAGFSFGGFVASRLCDYLPPERIKHIVLVGSIGLHPFRPGDRMELQNWRLATSPEMFRARHRHNLMALMLHDEEAANDFAVDIQILVTEKARFRRGRRIPNAGLSLSKASPMLSGIWGDQDCTAIGTFEHVEAALKAIDPDAELVLFAGGGHWIAFEAAERFNETILRLLHR